MKKKRIQNAIAATVNSIIVPRATMALKCDFSWASKHLVNENEKSYSGGSNPDTQFSLTSSRNCLDCFDSDDHSHVEDTLRQGRTFDIFLCLK